MVADPKFCLDCQRQKISISSISEFQSFDFRFANLNSFKARKHFGKKKKEIKSLKSGREISFHSMIRQITCFPLSISTRQAVRDEVRLLRPGHPSDAGGPASPG